MPDNPQQSYYARGQQQTSDLKQQAAWLRQKQHQLHDKNAQKHKTHLVMPLDIRMVSDIVLTLQGFGTEFDGNWLIEQVDHKIGQHAASTTTVSLYKCLGYPSQDPPVAGAADTITPGSATAISSSIPGATSPGQVPGLEINTTATSFSEGIPPGAGGH